MKIEYLYDEFEGGGEMKGYKYKKIENNTYAYIFEVKNIEDEDIVFYEVIKRRIVPLCIDFNNRIYSETEYKEVYPNANKFGDEGFIYKSLEKAINKFNKIYDDEMMKNNKS